MKFAAAAMLALGLVTSRSSAGKLLEEARFTLREAIEKAHAQVPEGSVVAARLRSQKGRTVFRVVLAQGTRTVSVALDAKTGEVVGRTEEAQDHSQALAASTVTVATAIETALGKVNGQAVAAKLEREGSRAVIEVEVFGAGKSFEVEIDGETGAVLDIEEEDQDREGNGR